MKSLRAAVSAVAITLFAVTASAGDHEAKPTIVSVAREAGSFETLLTALDAAKLTATLEGEGPFTVFAPTDAAFAALPAGTLEGLLADPDALAKVLTYHVVAGRVGSADIAGKASVDTLEGSALAIATEGGVKVGDANVVTADVAAGNGVIHVIDRVLIPAS